MNRSNYPSYIDKFSYIINDHNGKPLITAEDIMIIQDAIVSIQETLGENPQGNLNNIKEKFAEINKKMIKNDIPFNLQSQIITNEDGSKSVEVSWNYIESENIEHFILEVWDEETQTYKPYDGQLGIIQK